MKKPLRTPKYLQKYVRNSKKSCNCGVCLILSYIQANYGEIAAESWAYLGIEKEWDFIKSKISKKEYNKIYTKKFIDNMFKVIDR